MASQGLVTWTPEHSKKKGDLSVVGAIRESPGESGLASTNDPGRSTLREGETNVWGENLRRRSDGAVMAGKGEVVWQGDLVRGEPDDALVRPKNIFYSKFNQEGSNQPREVVWNGKEFVARQNKVKLVRTEDEASFEENQLGVNEEKPKVIKYKNILNSYNKVSFTDQYSVVH